MASCNACGGTILFGGSRDSMGRQYCNNECLQKDGLVRMADQLPRDLVMAHVQEMHQGRCPSCHGPGPVDVHYSHSIWSALIVSSWSSTPKICCRSCGTRTQAGSLALSLAVGWWGFPWGLIMTPVQVIRNLGGMVGGPHPSRPSAELERAVKCMLAAHFAEQARQPQAAPPVFR